MTQTTAVLVVNRSGHDGRCSNCNKPASLDTTTHDCGAVLDRVAIKTSEMTTRLDLKLAPAMARQHDKRFIGKGEIVQTTTGWTFRPALRRGS